ncbi:extracellular catalytic domain type 1 short-chain-length polyhydroxyalkanoate depolymerase [Aureimonas sp. AU40]|uniref:extracellular catalytic domain type 1 short-chain-length polyhydroxyalkanoate depolymerase n=1 Tax=Aureimonas sp. AU40 TaxID=1637747 RepID=UPI000ADDDF06|nr:PHB depolymerase family esterase [Aureimonas sp. AU40]
MTRSFFASMEAARRLVLQNDLTEATALIQAQLSGAAPSFDTPPNPAPAFAGPTLELHAEPAASPSPKPSSAAPSGWHAAPKQAAPRTRPRFPLPGMKAHGGMKAPTLPPGARFESLRHEGPHGARAYRLYTPSRPSEDPRPLVLMLHGCTQNPEDFAIGTRMNALAEEMNVLVAYPEQPRAANSSLCWNWFEPAHQRRGAGEPAILAGIVEDIARSNPVDRTRIFAAGLSAGGAMAAVLGAAYPDLLAAVGVHSGLPQGSADTVASALAVMRSGKAPGRGTARGARTIVFHGTADRTVNPINGEQLAGLADGDARGAETREGASGGRAFTRTIRPAGADTPAIEHWRIEGLGHAWSGGDAGGSHSDPIGPDASREMLRFFLQS